MLTEWVIGYIIGIVVVVIVVVLATILIIQARKIASQAVDILSALDEARANTDGLWDVDAVNRSLENTLDAARTARMVLSGGDS